MNLTVISNDQPASEREIQISGIELFTTNRWREAILHYLFGVWGDVEGVTYRPKIGLPPNLTLRLDMARGVYYAYGTSDEREPPPFHELQVLTVGHEQNDVEIGLARFVKSRRFEQLTITFPEGTRLCLWKGQKRGDLNCWSNVAEDHPLLHALPPT